MEMITYHGLPLELSVIGDTINDRLSLECWDLSQGGGLWFTLAYEPDGTMYLEPAGRTVPLDLLKQVAAIAETGLAEK
jgi:hypothetical protein